MKKNQVLVILLLIVLFILLKPSAYVATPPSAGPIHYKVYQGPPYTGLATVPTSPKILGNYQLWMDKYLLALQDCYVTTPEAVAYLKGPDFSDSLYLRGIPSFITQHNAFFKANPTANVCTWALSAIHVLEDSHTWGQIAAQFPNEQGLSPLRDYANYGMYSQAMISIADKLIQTYSSCGF